VKGVLAGLDQFGGTDEVEHLLAAVKEGEVSESRLDASVRRVLRQKLQLGLFEDPYVDPQEALLVVGAPELQKEADAAQRRAQVVLENRGVLPLAPSGKKVFLHKVDPALAARYGFTVVTDPAAAEVALIRTEAPFERLHPHHFFGSRQHEGRLDFRDGDPDYEVIKSASRRVPTVVSISLDRPAILTNLREKAAAILANFGASDPALLDVVTGRARAEGRLPFELPSSMEAVEAQAPDLPDDSRDPLYPRGYRFDR
jgi:beta-glucosidase